MFEVRLARNPASGLRNSAYCQHSCAAWYRRQTSRKTMCDVLSQARLSKGLEADAFGCRAENAKSLLSA
ncbi:unnamed protein product [Protopolystoma xenopodis]|uniref:Uncharacterized protein n=1 Tax=Protopolystoma xenopodis TaxID=117903 RepID=A0A3S5BFI6_9PLAT|nr:unnamed protein product [Protopolystoma xenopodis]